MTKTEKITLVVGIPIVLFFAIPYIAEQENKQNQKVAQQGCTPGSWYDDLGSPTFLDATFNIVNDNGTCKLHRVNGDGSVGDYPLDLVGNKHFKRGDKFGAYYIPTSNGLDIYDKNGFIRTAKVSN